MERNGYRVLEARDEPLTLDLWRSNSGDIDLLITDFPIPGMNGLELASKIIANDPGVVVIFISASPGHFMKEYTELKGEARLLGKPS